MVAAIPPLPPLPSSMSPLPVAPAVTVPVEPAAAAAALPPPPPAQVERFAALMQQHAQAPAAGVAGAAGAPNPHASHGASAVNRFVSSQDQAIASTLDNAKAFSIGDAASMPELAQHMVQVQTEMAMLTFKLNVANGLAQSGKSSVQTLMKNQ